MPKQDKAKKGGARRGPGRYVKLTSTGEHIRRKESPVEGIARICAKETDPVLRELRKAILKFGMV